MEHRSRLPRKDKLAMQARQHQLNKPNVQVFELEHVNEAGSAVRTTRYQSDGSGLFKRAHPSRRNRSGSRDAKPGRSNNSNAAPVADQAGPEAKLAEISAEPSADPPNRSRASGRGLFSHLYSGSAQPIQATKNPVVNSNLGIVPLAPVPPASAPAPEPAPEPDVSRNKVRSKQRERDAGRVPAAAIQQRSAGPSPVHPQVGRRPSSQGELPSGREVLGRLQGTGAVHVPSDTPDVADLDASEPDDGGDAVRRGGVRDRTSANDSDEKVQPEAEADTEGAAGRRTAAHGEIARPPRKAALFEAGRASPASVGPGLAGRGPASIGGQNVSVAIKRWQMHQSRPGGRAGRRDRKTNSTAPQSPPTTSPARDDEARPVWQQSLLSPGDDDAHGRGGVHAAPAPTRSRLAADNIQVAVQRYKLSNRRRAGAAGRHRGSSMYYPPVEADDDDGVDLTPRTFREFLALTYGDVLVQQWETMPPLVEAMPDAETNELMIVAEHGSGYGSRKGARLGDAGVPFPYAETIRAVAPALRPAGAADRHDLPAPQQPVTTESGPHVRPGFILPPGVVPDSVHWTDLSNNRAIQSALFDRPPGMRCPPAWRALMDAYAASVHAKHVTLRARLFGAWRQYASWKSVLKSKVASFWLTHATKTVSPAWHGWMSLCRAQIHHRQCLLEKCVRALRAYSIRRMEAHNRTIVAGEYLVLRKKYAALLRLRDFSKEHRLERELDQRAKEYFAEKYGRTAVRKWRNFTTFVRTDRSLEQLTVEHHRRRLMARVLRAWRRQTSVQRAAFATMLRHARHVVQRTFTAWRDRVVEKQRRTLQRADADLFYKLCVAVRTFGRWRQHADQQIRLRAAHTRFKHQRVLGALRWWRLYARGQRFTSMQELVLGRKHTERVARAAFVAWRDSARISHAVATMRRRIIGRNTRQAWFHFKFGIMWSARLRASNELATRFHRFKTLSSAFYDMRVGVRLSVWEQIADRHCERSTARKAMLAWRAGMAAQHEERLAEEQAIIDERSEVTRPVFQRWLSLYDRRRARREQQRRADVFYAFTAQRRMWDAWKARVAEAKAAQNRADVFAIHREISLARKLLTFWHYWTFRWEELARRVSLRRKQARLQQWRLYIQHRRNRKEANALARLHFRSTTLTRSMEAWEDYVHARAARQAMLRTVDAWAARNLAKRVLREWVTNVRALSESQSKRRQAIQHFQLNLARRTLQLWHTRTNERTARLNHMCRTLKLPITGGDAPERRVQDERGRIGRLGALTGTLRPLASCEALQSEDDLYRVRLLRKCFRPWLHACRADVFYVTRTCAKALAGWKEAVVRQVLLREKRARGLANRAMSDGGRSEQAPSTVISRAGMPGETKRLMRDLRRATPTRRSMSPRAQPPPPPPQHGSHPAGGAVFASAVASQLPAYARARAADTPPPSYPRQSTAIAVSPDDGTVPRPRQVPSHVGRGVAPVPPPRRPSLPSADQLITPEW